MLREEGVVQRVSRRVLRRECVCAERVLRKESVAQRECCAESVARSVALDRRECSTEGAAQRGC